MFNKKNRSSERIYIYTQLYIMFDERFESKVSVFYGKDQKALHLWNSRVITALKRRELISAIADKSEESEMNENALSVIVYALGDNPLRALKGCELTKELLENTQERYAGKTVINKTTLLQNFFNMTHESLENMGDYVAILKSQFARLSLCVRS